MNIPSHISHHIFLMEWVEEIEAQIDSQQIVKKLEDIPKISVFVSEFMESHLANRLLNCFMGLRIREYKQIFSNLNKQFPISQFREVVGDQAIQEARKKTSFPDCLFVVLINSMNRKKISGDLVDTPDYQELENTFSYLEDRGFIYLFRS